MEIRILKFGIWNLEFGIWNLESGIWNLESGIHQQYLFNNKQFSDFFRECGAFVTCSGEQRPKAIACA